MSSSLWRMIVMVGAFLTLLCMIGLLIRKPRSPRQLLINALLGIGALFVFQWILPSLGMQVPVNLVSLSVAGGLGLPGAILVVAIGAVLS